MVKRLLKNKKGLTMVEIIAVIVILIIIFTVAISSTITMIKNKKLNSLKKLERNIVEAAELYFSTDKEAYDHLVTTCKSIKIPLSTIQKAGYLDSDLKNPVTGTKLVLENELVEASMNCDGEIVYQYNDTITGDPKYTCNMSDLPRAAEEEKPGNNLDFIKQHNQSFIYKGADPNNYVKFTYNGDTNALWRIISIGDDGSLKIISTFDVGDLAKYHNNGAFTIAESILNYVNPLWIKETKYCKESTNSNTSIVTFSIKNCNEVEKKVFLIQMSDIVNASSGGNYLLGLKTWTSSTTSASFEDAAFYTTGTGVAWKVYKSSATFTYSVKPVITLVSSVKIKSGIGTQGKPYILEKE